MTTPENTPINLSSLLEARVAATPDKAFLFSESDGRRFTYREFDDIVNRVCAMLRELRINRGDVVSLLMPNSAEYIIAYFACWTIGALAGPVNSLLKPPEIVFILGNSEAKALLVNSAFLASINEIRAELPQLQSVVVFDDAEVATCKIAASSISDSENQPLETDDEAIIIYTSGTTGKPKGCLLTHGNLIANARQISEWLKFTPEDRLLTIMPLFHMNAVSVTTMSALYAGGSTVVSPKFSASRFWDIIENYKITSFGSVATMLSMLLAKADASDIPHSALRTPHLRFAMCGSAPVPAEVLKRFEETFN